MLLVHCWCLGCQCCTEFVASIQLLLCFEGGAARFGCSMCMSVCLARQVDKGCVRHPWVLCLQFMMQLGAANMLPHAVQHSCPAVVLRLVLKLDVMTV